MLYAINQKGEKVRPTYDNKDECFCPCCETGVIAKMGSINIWHWAHKSNISDCAHKPESEWHLSWKRMLPKDNCEVVIKKDGVKKIADIMLNNGRVVELQNSSISSEEIKERERFYGRMIWIFNCIDAYENDRLLLRDKGDYYSFRWKWAKRSISHAKSPIYLDIGYGSIFRIKKNYHQNWSGWGKLERKSSMTYWLKNKCLDHAEIMRKQNENVMRNKDWILPCFQEIPWYMQDEIEYKIRIKN